MSHEHLDVLIIGAGLSGIGAAVHLQKKCPGKTYAILEMREAMGGTWDLFRYPGIRSDSDMYTLGYYFKPWTNPKAIADGDDILAYIRETAEEYGVQEKIRYRHKVTGLSWSTRDARWTVHAERTDTGEPVAFTAGFVVGCSGYYKYEHGYTPDFPGIDEYQGTLVHPQKWPEDLDYDGKKIVVIGSGATAVTLVPALTERAGHVTMLQRSPTYVANVPREGAIGNALRGKLPEKVSYHLTRAAHVLMAMGFFQFTRRFPKRARGFLLDKVQAELGEGFDMSHFTPRYDPWDERLCAVPDGDMFEVIKEGKASVVTDHIERFTDEGILLKSGEELEADIVVTATGLILQVLGGAEVTVDGEPVKASEKLYYKGAMLEDVPNLAMVFGYTNSSWTLKADLILDLVCRLLNRMDARGDAICTPRNSHGAQDGGPFIDLTSGYIQRALHMLPRQGESAPWRLYQNYLLDFVMMRLRPLEDGALVFEKAPVTSRARVGAKHTPAHALN